MDTPAIESRREAKLDVGKTRRQETDECKSAALDCTFLPFPQIENQNIVPCKFPHSIGMKTAERTRRGDCRNYRSLPETNESYSP